VEELRLMIIGLGNVGQALLQIIRDDTDFLEKRYAVRLIVVAVNDFRLGSLYNPDGLSLQDLREAPLTSTFCPLSMFPLMYTEPNQI